MFNNIGSGEILIVAIVLILLFGGKKLPELARGLGESGKELKKAKKEIDNALNDISTPEIFKEEDADNELKNVKKEITTPKTLKEEVKKGGETT
jgi:sec-independent protein translocase protein TatA